MKKRLINFFQRLRIFIFAALLVPLCIGVFILIGIHFHVFEGPTATDYKLLHNQEDKLKEDFENVYLMERASINIHNSEINVILVSETDANYELHITFDENKEFMKSEEICNKSGFVTYSENPKMEKYKPIMLCVCGGVLSGIYASLGLWSIYCAIYSRVTKNKNDI